MKKDIYISVDIESDGPIPGEYSMISLGACVVYDHSKTFYTEIKPISDKWVPEALAVSGLDRERLVKEAPEAATATLAFREWVREVSKCPKCGMKDGMCNTRAVFVGFNASFDWMWTNWYFHKFLGNDPFGIAGIDIKAYYLGYSGHHAWSFTTKKNLPKRFKSGLIHTHNALDDAVEQAIIFERIRNEALSARHS